MCSDRPIFRQRLGLIVNPIAGMGGKVGLKGTDGPAVLAEARRRGATPLAGARARQALAAFASAGAVPEIVTGPGELGETIARDLGFRPRVVGQDPKGDASDTRAAAEAMAGDVDLILFAGGDGTARDLFDVVGGRVPVLGIPTGVKMHSAVFATTPENAGAVAASYFADAARHHSLRDAEIMDLDDAGTGRGQVQAKLYGYARVPYVRSRVQHAKAGGGTDDEADLDALCRMIAGNLEPGCVHLIGPGTTTQRILRYAGLEGTLLGVDAVSDGRLIGTDLSEAEILALTEGRPVRLIVGVIGGQGFLFGRGNQPLSAAVLRRLGRDRITVVSSLSKILSLDEHRLLVDTGDREMNASLAGFIRVQTAPDHSLLLKVAA